MELVKLDLGYRWQRTSNRDAATVEHGATPVGEPSRLSWKPRLEEYLSGYPELGPPAELPVSLIATEYRTRLLAGDRPQREDYLARFPEQRDELNELFARMDDDGTKGPQPAEPGWQPGTRVKYFGDYELLEEIARGGMGVVYKARQRSLNRIVALKMILAGQLAGEQEVQRFHAEAEAAAILDHPGIVPIYEVGEHEGQHFYSMGYVEGESLAKRLASGPLAAKEATELIVAVAEAVAYAHGKGVIHRDLKPANILLDCQGRPRITDFGLAKRVSGEAGLTATGQVLGTPSYMPREQALGSLDQIKETADVYALGATLYALLTGRPPFQSANPMDTLLQVISAEPVSLRQLNAKLSRNLETICQKCLEKEPRRRYATAHELADELRRNLDGKPIHARRIGWVARAWRWCRRNPAVAALTITTAIALIAGIAVSTSLAILARNHARTADKQTELATSRLNEVRLNSVGQQLARVSELWQRDPQRALELLENTEDCPLPLRDFTWGLLYNACVRSGGTPSVGGLESATLNVAQDVTFPVASLSKARHTAISADGLAWIDREGDAADAMCVQPCAVFRATAASSQREEWDGNVRLWDAATGKMRRQLAGRGAAVRCVLFSPAGETLASAGADDTIRLWDPVTGEMRAALKGHAGRIQSLAFSHRGEMLASAGFDQAVRIWDVPAGTLRAELKAAPGEYREEVISATFSADDSRLVCSGTAVPRNGGYYQKLLRVWDVSSGELVAHHIEPGTFLGVAPYSGNAATVSTCCDGKIKKWNLSDLRPCESVNCCLSKSFFGGWGVWSADGAMLAATARDLEAGTIWLCDRETGRLRSTLREHFRFVTSMCFSRDGKTLATASADRTVRLWNATTGKLRATLPAHNAETVSVAFSPDGKSLLTAGADNTVKIWATSGDRLYGEFRNGGDDGMDISKLGFSPDGRVVVSHHGSHFSFWDVHASRLIRQFRNGRGLVTFAGFSRDRASVAFEKCELSDSHYWETRGHGILDTNTGRVVREYTLDGYKRVVLSPEHHRFAVNQPGSCEIRDVATGKIIGRCEDAAVMFSPDGRALLSYSSETRQAKVLDGTTGALRANLGERETGEGNPELLGR